MKTSKKTNDNKQKNKRKQQKKHGRAKQKTQKCNPFYCSAKNFVFFWDSRKVGIHKCHVIRLHFWGCTFGAPLFFDFSFSFSLSYPCFPSPSSSFSPLRPPYSQNNRSEFPKRAVLGRFRFFVFLRFCVSFLSFLWSPFSFLHQEQLPLSIIPN